jgi:hypothetical protein
MTSALARPVEPLGQRASIALADLVASVPGIRLATPDDNARILAFFDRTPMLTSSYALQYRRSPDFFNLLRYQSDHFHVLMSMNGRGDVTGLGTISPRPAWVGGEATTVGYLGDLRVEFDRHAIRHWRRLFGDLITHAGDIRELAGCTHWLTTIMDDNQLARRVLASGRGGAPTCVRIAPFTMRNIVGRIPFARTSDLRSPWEVRWAQPDDLERLTAFVEAHNRDLQFGFRGELARRLAQWDSLALSDFLIVMHGDSIVGCVAPWSASRAKQILVSRLPIAMRALERASTLLPGGRLQLPRAGEPLRVGYLTHLNLAANLTDADRVIVFRALLDRVFDRWGSYDWHCLAFADFAEWNLGRALRGYIQQTVPISIYAVLPPGSAPSDATRQAGRPPAFEMATI